MFCVLENKKYICTYVSKHNTNHQKQVIFSWFQMEKDYIYCSKKIPAKHHGIFNSLTCLHSFATENKRESHKKVCKNKIFCNIVMPSEDTKILEFNQYQKSHKPPFII